MAQFFKNNILAKKSYLQMYAYFDGNPSIQKKSMTRD